MHRLRRFALSATVVMVVAGWGLLPSTAAHADSPAQTMRLRAAIKNLPVASETRAGYEREKFRDWYDADGDCRDTRDEVLAAESRVRVTGCDVRAGDWRSYYDGATTKNASTFDIDHMVPLAEAWDSGAKRWSTDARDRFANDLGDARSLVAVSASSNRSKGDRDPAEWLPALAKCRYIREYTAVKVRWRLKVDSAEKSALTRRAASCNNVTFKVRRAAL